MKPTISTARPSPPPPGAYDKIHDLVNQSGCVLARIEEYGSRIDSALYGGPIENGPREVIASGLDSKLNDVHGRLLLLADKLERVATNLGEQ